jgi:hypothetical protein
MEGRKRVTAGRHGNIAEQVRECTPSRLLKKEVAVWLIE